MIEKKRWVERVRLRVFCPFVFFKQSEVKGWRKRGIIKDLVTLIKGWFQSKMIFIVYTRKFGDFDQRREGNCWNDETMRRKENVLVQRKTEACILYIMVDMICYRELVQVSWNKRQKVRDTKDNAQQNKRLQVRDRSKEKTRMVRDRSKQEWSVIEANKRHQKLVAPTEHSSSIRSPDNKNESNIRTHNKNLCNKLHSIIVEP